MTDDPTIRSASDSAFKLGTLLIAALIVAPLASCGASLAVSGSSLAMSAATTPDMDAGTAILAVAFIALMATIVSLLFVFVALLLLALPLTLLMARLGVPALARDLILLAVAAGAGWLLRPLSAELYEGQGWIFLAYTLAAAVFWVAALRRIERRNAAA